MRQVKNVKRLTIRLPSRWEVAALTLTDAYSMWWLKWQVSMIAHLGYLE